RPRFRRVVRRGAGARPGRPSARSVPARAPCRGSDRAGAAQRLRHLVAGVDHCPRTAAAMTVITRSLSRTQAATRRSLIDAGIALATEGGYEAVGMRQVAARAGVSAATAY